MKARISQLHKTESEWAKLSSIVPEAGELIVYDPDKQHNYARVKIGDGKRTIKELTFFIDSAISTYLQNQRYSEVIDGGRITDFK
jgi:hypothetical protein